ncbi:TPA: hypothetical protein DEG21_01280 [Patescibacteria group bacterium]|nr:hypothetical protein [Candidatus Gracilibacteria bacterium]HBY74530.1 hypothetical protein [Candidatus Gracilibacteria bacterium]
MKKLSSIFSPSISLIVQEFTSNLSNSDKVLNLFNFSFLDCVFSLCSLYFSLMEAKSHLFFSFTLKSTQISDKILSTFFAFLLSFS